MNKPILIQTTFETSADAKRLAGVLLAAKLVACAQVSGPMDSMYWWDGAVEESPEFRLTLKSFDTHYQQIEQVILREHPYDVPEIIAIGLSHVNEPYRLWMEQEIRP